MVRRFSILLLLAVAFRAIPEYALALQSQNPPDAPCPETSAASDTSKSGSTDGSVSKKKGDKSSPAPPCTAPDAKEPPAAQRFPFPGETPAPPLPGSPSAAPDAPAPSGHHPSAAEEHPFPGSAPPMPSSDSGSSDSSSSSSSSDDSSSSSSSNPNDSTALDGATPPLDDKGDNPRAASRRRLPKVEKLQTDEDRADEDLKVAKFYEQKGDLNAAYLRTRDAVKYQPSDPETHLALARIAQKLNKRDEAIAEYNAYLQLDPDGTEINQAHKALAQLQH